MLYRKHFDCHRIFYVNIETGEEKEALSAGDICVGNVYQEVIR